MKTRIFSFEWFPFLTTFLLHARVTWSIRLRFLAITGYFLATLIAKFGFNIILPYDKIWILLAILLFINLVYSGISLLVKDFSFIAELIILHIHIIIDLIVLTFLVHYSGGMENPIYLFYVFHVVISSIIFPGIIPIFFATFVIILFSILIYLEYYKIVEHYYLFAPGIHDNPIAIYMTLAVFIITVYVTTYFCTSFMQIYRDIKRQIDIKNQKLIKADRHKSQFFKFASHELKSPLIAIKTSMDAIVKNYSQNLDVKVLDILKRASFRSDQMLLILGDLLELAKNKKIAFIENNEIIDINNIIKEVVNNELMHAEEKNITINLTLSANMTSIQGNLDDLKKVFINLIDNAIRYNIKDGQINISTNSDGKNLDIQIKDTGIGIPEKDLEKIFDEFYRSENAKKIVNFGTGLGLSLVKQIIENYDGTIMVESKINKGSTFNIQLPIHRRVNNLMEE
jgi:signal transduction histidine kinase